MKKMSDRPLPHNLELEKHLLGYILLNAKTFDDVIDVCSLFDESLFYSEKNRIVFNEMKKLISENIKPDLVVLNASESVEYEDIVEYIDSGCMEFQVDGVIEKLKDIRARRDAIIKLKTEESSLYSQEKTATDVVEEIAKISEQISNDHTKVKEVTTADVIIESVKQIQEANTSSNNVRVKYHCWVDNLFSVYRQQVIALSGIQGLGKTALALTLIRNQIKSGLKGAYFITESTAHEIFKRIIGQEAQIPIQYLLEGFPNGTKPDDIRKINSAVQTFNALKDNFKIIDRNEFGNDVNNIAPILRKLKRKLGTIDFCYIDHINDLKYPKGIFEEHRAIGENSARIKDCAVSIDCPITMLAQCTKDENKKGRPSLMSLRGDSKLADALHGALFLYRDNLDLSQRFLKTEFYAVNKRLMKPFSEFIYYDQASLQYCQYNGEGGKYLNEINQY